MGKIFSHCPSCGNQKLSVTKIECQECATVFAGHFDIPVILKLGEEDLKFIMAFVKCSGSLKDMAKIQSVSYPTLRNRLNELIGHVQQLEDSRAQQKDHILQMLEAGKITAKDAAKQLQDL